MGASFQACGVSTMAWAALSVAATMSSTAVAPASTSAGTAAMASSMLPNRSIAVAVRGRSGTVA